MRNHRSFRRIWKLGLIALQLCWTGFAAECVLPPSGLTAWWPGDGDTNSLVTGSGVTLQNGAAFAAGFVGSAFNLDGSDDYVSTSIDAQPSAMPNSTWEAWIYPTRVNYGTRQQIFSTDDGGYDRSVLIESGTSKFAVFTGIDAWQPTDVTPNQWQHVAVVFSPTNILFYKNGVPFSLNRAPSGQSTGFPLQIGRNPGFGEYFQGLVDEVTVYRRALRADEIVAIYSAGASGKCKSSAASVDLTLSTIGPGNVVAKGSTFALTVTLQNNGPGPATGINIVNELTPAIVTLASATVSSGEVEKVGNTVRAYVNSLAPGGTVLLNLSYTADVPGMVTNHVSFFANEPDPAPGNNTSTRTVRISPGPITAEDGDWSENSVTLVNTPEAALMVRVGDIDNLGFGWPSGFNPFTGASTPVHGFPWAIDPADPAGTDRIFVPSSYDGHAGSVDGYTGTTKRPDNLPQPITMQYAPVTASAAALQMFVDDFQAPAFGSKFQLKLNDVEAPALSAVLNQLVQTGPIGKLLTLQIPSEFLPAVQSGQLKISIDDTTTGAGDGFAIDFVKLLVNPGAFAQVGIIQGKITDSADGKPIASASVYINGKLSATTGLDGLYSIPNVTAGLAVLDVRKLGYATALKSLDLLAGQTATADINLVRQLQLAVAAAGPQTVIVSWPAYAANTHLQFTPSLTNPQWTDVQTPPTVIGDLYQLSFNTNGKEGYFRLKQ